MDDIPGDEWEVILAERCGLPPSHCKLLVKVLHELQVQLASRVVDWARFVLSIDADLARHMFSGWR